ncbi:MAG: hypothetical protein VKP57_12635 [Candidatus Sericytochromatia bacterium]|nr:hypothetical protein [Candidatus Sericytochromatia bacterium]
MAWEDQILWLPATESLEKPASEEIATTLLVVAADMLVAGARAWLVYALTHRGDAFDRDACAQAIITAMVAEALAAVPIVGRVLSSLLLPVVLAWIARSGKWPWQVDTKALLTSGADLHRHFVRALARSLTIMGNPS